MMRTTFFAWIIRYRLGAEGPFIGDESLGAIMGRSAGFRSMRSFANRAMKY
jgi:hypothetical protein